MQEELLKLENLLIQYKVKDGYLSAVNGVNCTINKGEVFAIVGESGCGKSTVAHSIMKLLPGSNAEVTGKIIFKGNNLLEMDERKIESVRGKEIGMIFQNPLDSLNPVYTVGSQVAEAIALDHVDRVEAWNRVIELFKSVKMPDAEERVKSFPHELSGGMRQRVMIAMALANKPELLIADEPTTALDVTIQDQILKQLRELEKEYGTSIIFITHDLGVVAELCDRVIVMYGGLVMEEASIFDIFEQPKHPYTMGLLASIPDLHQDKSVRLMPIPGSPPDMTNPPKGCPFAPRCPYARNICAAELPEFTEVGENHHSRCFLLYPDAPADENNPFRSKE